MLPCTLTMYLQSFKHVFTFPNSVNNANKATQSSDAHIHGMTGVTPALITYIATQVSFLLVRLFPPSLTLMPTITSRSNLHSALPPCFPELIPPQTLKHSVTVSWITLKILMSRRVFRSYWYGGTQ